MSYYEEEKMTAVEACMRSADYERGFQRGYNEGYNIAIKVYLEQLALQVNPIQIKVDKDNVKFVVCEKCNKLVSESEQK